MKAAPPGWEAHRIVTRIDGWVVDPETENRIPAAVAAMMARAMPQPTEIDIRARMITRQRMMERRHGNE